ncbi:hypothetical protein LOC67_07045 [Stieleria sp. JC731]|uniref:hypothetical protein n=1 Tax=Pirellulaceae TaxID=2691357 RepID=UPI001E302723|nr:hypothetical protein [Stieleria sp. JC731]MCC9600313.1 hypothetical protein [Stieleria sp. JC731]
MNISQLRKKATTLITQGAADYQRRTGHPVDTAVSINHKTGEVAETLSVRRRSVDHEEFDRTYGKAQDLLLKHGYEKSQDAEVQSLYAELIPDSDDLKAQKRGPLKDLRSRDEPKRLAAAKECSKAARGIGISDWNPWPKNPIVTEAIIKALAKEKSTKVAELLIIALASIHKRYYADSRIPPILIAYLDSDDGRLQQTALNWTNSLQDRTKWPKILEMLDTNPSMPILVSALQHLYLGTPVGIKRAACPILMRTAKRKLSDEAKLVLHGAILDMVDERTLAEYKSALADEKRLTKSLAKHAEKEYGKGHDRFKFLQANLFK